MTVIRPNSVAGINSITVQSGNSLAVHKSDGSLIRTITANSGVSTFSSISVGTATTDNSAAKSINIGLGASIAQHNDNSLTFGTNGDPRITIDASGDFNVGSAATIKAGGNATFSGIVTAASFVGDGSGLTGAGPSLTGSTNNTIVTVTGANAIQGEANLTFDGDDLLIKSSTDGRRISFAGDGTSHYMKYDNTLGGIILNGYGGIAFETNGTNERLRISSGGNVQVNGSALHLDASGELAVFETDTNLAFTNSAKLAFDFSGNVARIRTSGNGSFTARNLGFYHVNSQKLLITTDKVMFSADAKVDTNNTRDLGTSGNRWKSLFLGTQLEIDAASSTEMIRLDVAGTNFATIGHNTSSGSNMLDVRSEGHMRFLTNGNNERLRITSGGNVNIGSNPTQTTYVCEVHGAYNKDGMRIVSGAPNYQDPLVVSSSTGGERFRIKGDGDIVATGNLKTNNLSARNIVINGDMRVAQRATSASMSSSGNAVPVCDRWQYNRNGPSSTIAQVADTPDGKGFYYSLKWTNTSPVGSIAAGNVVKFSYGVERQDIQRLGYGTSSAKTATLSFWAKGSLSGKVGVAFTRDSRVFSANEDIVANTWKFVEITIPADTSTGFSASNNANGFNFGICWGAGSNSTSGAVGSWINFHNAYTAGFTAGQQGAYLTTNGSTFQITGVQLEIGSVSTPFEHRDYGEELERCFRYYHKDLNRRAYWGSGNVGDRQFPVRFIVEMRDTPTMSFHSTSLDSGSAAAYSTNRQGYNFAMTGSGRFYEWAHIADAEF